MKNEICELLNIKYPILQGGMAWIADSSLASAVSNAGGLGIIAAGNAPADYVREQIRQTRELTDKPFGVNIMLLSPFVDEIIEMVCEEGIKVVTTGGGSTGMHISKWKAQGIKVIPVVPSVAIAKRMERIGADAVIAEGMESGGHVGKLTTMALVPQVADAVKIPVIAAGGIFDGRGITAALALGAKAVQVGTRFVLSKECTAHENYKEAIKKAKDIDTIITGVSTGHPVRVLKNKLTRKLEVLDKTEGKVEEFESLGTGAYRKAVKEGDTENGSIMSGQIAGALSKEQSVSEIIEEMFNEYNSVVKGLKNS